jgi:hypothetical protein
MPCTTSELQVYSLAIPWGRMMRASKHSLIFYFTIFLTANAATAQKLALSTRILSAKTVYFNDKTGSDAVGRNALAQLRKWGRFAVVPDQKEADLIFLFSADPYRGGNIILSGGQTGSIDNQGHIEEDRIPNYHKQSPTRDAYLTVIDAKTGEILWSRNHVWGGALTGFNSAAARLIKQLESQTKK